MTYIIKHFNEEVQFNGETKEEVIEKLLNAYNFDVVEYDGELKEFNGAKYTAEKVADFEAGIEAQEKAKKIVELKAKLSALDLTTIRPLRAGETDKVAELEAQAIELRNELKELLPNENTTESTEA